MSGCPGVTRVPATSTSSAPPGGSGTKSFDGKGSGNASAAADELVPDAGGDDDGEGEVDEAASGCCGSFGCDGGVISRS
jgi:hypothetical protein